MGGRRRVLPVFEGDGGATVGVDGEARGGEGGFAVTDAAGDTDAFLGDADEVGGEFAVGILVMEDGDGVGSGWEVFEGEVERSFAGLGFGACGGVFGLVGEAFFGSVDEGADFALIVTDALNGEGEIGGGGDGRGGEERE